ncbi:hypothetical protein LTR41_012021, partial [Exophiala xenobiotica]
RTPLKPRNPRIPQNINSKTCSINPIGHKANTKAQTDSEPSFFNYINALSAERSYLLRDAHPDWKHKAQQAGLLSPTCPYANLPITYRGKAMTIGQWMQQLSAAEPLWVDTARAADLPDFDATVKEYQSPSDSESVRSMLT